MRTVILHYHLFKNAGTSLDATFKENFAEGEWLTKEFSSQPEKNKKEVAEWIVNNPNAKCFSSHTAMLHVAQIENVKVLPVIFVRHPIDRIASVYNFEKNQVAESFGAVLARNTNMAGYIETRLSLRQDRQCRNFHIDRFAAMISRDKGTELERALIAIQELPFVGIVERFDNSLQRLENWLRGEGFQEIELNAWRKNVSRDTNKTLQMKLSEIEAKTGKKIFQCLQDENREDMVLYHKVIESALSVP